MIRRALLSSWKTIVNSQRGATMHFAMSFCTRLVLSSKGSSFSGSHLLPGLASRRLGFSTDLLALVSSRLKKGFFESAKQLIQQRNIVRNLASSKLRDVSRTIPWALCYEGRECLWHGEFMQLVLRMWRFYTLARLARRYKLPIPTTIDVPLLLRENYLCSWAEAKERKTRSIVYYYTNLLRRTWQFLKLYTIKSKKKVKKNLKALLFRTQTLKHRAFSSIKIFYFSSRWTIRVASICFNYWKTWSSISARLMLSTKIIQGHVSLHRMRDSFHNWRMAFRQRRLLSIYSTSIFQGTAIEVVSLSENTTISLRYREADSRGVLTAVQACLYFLGDPGSQSLLISAWKSWVRFSVRRRTWQRLLFIFTKSHAHHIMRTVFVSWRRVCNKAEQASRNQSDWRFRTVCHVTECEKFVSQAKSSLKLESNIDEGILEEALLSPVMCPLDSSATSLLSRLRGEFTSDDSATSYSTTNIEDSNRTTVPCRSTISTLCSYVRDETSLRKRSRSPLHIAADECDERTVRELLGMLHLQSKEVRSGLVNARNECGRSPLHLACRHISSNYTGIVILLIECGAHVLSLDDEGMTPIDIAANKSIRRLLTSHVQRIKQGNFTQYERQIYRARFVYRWKSILLFDVLYLVVHALFFLRKGQRMRLTSSTSFNSSDAVTNDRSFSPQILNTLKLLVTLPMANKEECENRASTQIEDRNHVSLHLLRAITFFTDNNITNSLALDALVKFQAEESTKRRRLRQFTEDRSHLLFANAAMRANLANFKDCSNERNMPFQYKNCYRDATLLARIKYRKRDLLEKSNLLINKSLIESRTCVLEGILSELSRSSEPELQLIRARRSAGVALVFPLIKSEDEKRSQMLSSLFQIVENPIATISTLDSIASEWELDAKNKGNKEVLIKAAIGQIEGSIRLSKDGSTSKGGISDDIFSTKLLLDSAESNMREILLNASKLNAKAAANCLSEGKQYGKAHRARRCSINDILSKMFMLQRLRQALASSIIEFDPLIKFFHDRSTFPSAELAMRKQAAESHRSLLSRSDTYAGLIYSTGNPLIDNSPLLHSWDLIRARIGIGYYASGKRNNFPILKKLSDRETALLIHAQLQVEASSVPKVFADANNLLPLYSRVIHLPLDNTLHIPRNLRRLSNSQEFSHFISSCQDNEHQVKPVYENNILHSEILFFSGVKSRHYELLLSLNTQLSLLENRKNELLQCLTLCIYDLVNVENGLPDSIQSRSFRELQLSSTALNIISESRSRDLVHAEKEFSRCSLLLAEAITSSSLRRNYRTPPEVVDRMIDNNEAERSLIYARQSQQKSTESQARLFSELRLKKQSIESKSATLLVDIDLMSSQMASIDASISQSRLQINKLHVRLAQLTALENEALIALETST